MADSFIARTLSRSLSVFTVDEEKVFGSSYREEKEDEEEALQWAAIEKLPTFNRLSKGILAVDGEPLKEIDVKGLSLLQRKSLLDRLIKVGEEDHERFLLKLKDRIDRVGMELPTVEVRFEHLKVEAEAYVGSRSLPSFINSTLTFLESVVSFLRIFPNLKRSFTIINDVSGIIKPRRMALLIGPPSSGKTSLLQALAGKLRADLKVSGRITYNGEELDKIIPQRTAAYISQDDLHMREMTVRETLLFSAMCQGVGCRNDMMVELLRREKEANIKPDLDIDIFMKAASLVGNEAGITTDYIIKILGLDICANTLIGDQMLRGISGGQKRRVTTGEMIVGPAQALFMDEISNGLDSSTTFQIVNTLRQIIHILGGTALISLLQPAPETYNLFDDIILISNGHIVYQGPRENVLEFFISMGFRCPERKGIADFLQEVTSEKDQKQYWVRLDQPYQYVSAIEFAEGFRSFHVCKDIRNDLLQPFDKAKSHPSALTTAAYGVSKMKLLKACITRELLLIKRNSFVYAFRSFKVLITSLIMMTVYFRTNMHRESVDDGSIFLGSLFFSVMNIMFNGFSELSLTISTLPVIFKQRDSLFYPSWAYALPTWILKIPFSFIEVSFMVLLNYYVIGYDPSFGRFVKQFLLLFLVAQMTSGLYRSIAVIARTMILASALTLYALSFFLIVEGYIISHDYIRNSWIWGYWISPLMYAQNSIAVNEFLGNSWSHHIEPTTNQTLGVRILIARGIFPEAKWYWIGVIALLGYVLLFNFLFSISLSYVRSPKKISPLLAHDTLNEKAKNSSVPDELISSQSCSLGYANEERVMALPFRPLSITFDNIKYSVAMPPEMKAQGFGEKLVLLNGLSGCFRPGVLTALMGISGAGKTTLMDVLAGRKTSGYIEGKISVSGYPKNQQTFARISGYCEQTDIHSPHVTVYESLMYSSWLRLSREVDSISKKMFIEEVMELVEMTPLKDALVGLPTLSGLSLEQRKRLTIAVELVANPSIIFMDEPTSGIDARAAAVIMRTIRNIVNTGRTVVCTIHQPSIDIFDTFDELFLMQRGGKEIYVGPIGNNGCNLINYFEEIHGVNKIKDGYNPATWVLEVTTDAQEKLLGVNFSEIYMNSDLFQKNRALIEEYSKPAPGSSALHFPTNHSQTFFAQCIICLWKQYLSYSRNYSYTTMRFFITLLLALTFGTVFWDRGGRKEKKQDLFNAMGSMYGSVLFLGIIYSSWVQPVVSIERIVFYREKATGMYSALPYAISQVLIELPYIFVQSIVYSVLVYAMIGFDWTAKKFLWNIFFTYFTLLYFTFYGMVTVSVTPNLHVANIIITTFYSLWNLFGGFIVPRSRIPIWWRWYYWACPIAWSLYGLLVSQYGDYNSKIDNDESVADFLRSFYGFRYDFLKVVAIMVVFFAIFFAFLFVFAIKYLNFQKR